MLSVIVPARDAEATLGRTLAALAAQQTTEAYEVIVVDDGSHDATAAIARAAPAPVTVVSQPAAGPAAARNLGARHARGDRLAFCDADVFPVPGWLAAGAAALARHELVQGRVAPDPDVPRGAFDRSLHIDGAVGLWETANLFVTRELFERVGGFQAWIAPRRGKALAEDVWFGHRALRAGARAGFSAEALAHHAVFSRHARGYVAERARLRFFPAMVARMPELRTAFLHRRVFLNPRTARFDLATAGALLATSPRARARWRAAGLLAALPYARAVQIASARAPGRPPGRLGVAAADVAADAAGAAALAWGSLRYRSIVL
ncbi:MAG TPA: glycosyltransferase family A protein [Solirubrobacteraceae bacterium]|nr:glycosyltransferase family A protein [Solirubrobacteraceae bacterium]